MNRRRIALQAALLVTTGFSLSGCSKLGELVKPQGSLMPAEPFSIDCVLKSYFVGTSVNSPLPEPPTLQLQFNPKGKYYRITQYSGSFLSRRAMEEMYARSLNSGGGNAVAATEAFSGPTPPVPFLGVTTDGTQGFRFDGKLEDVLILAEENEYRFKFGENFTASVPPANPTGVLGYMSLNLKERTLDIELEWRRGLRSYAEYRTHRAGGPFSMTFRCARSPAGTVIQVNGFRQ